MGVDGLEPGAVVGGRYRVVRKLGEGAMGWVWEASHAFTHKRVALKVLKSDRVEDRRRFQREIRAAASVRHPNVIDVHDFIELPAGTLVMVMDLLDGETLGTVLEREKTIALGDLCAVLVPVMSALEATHAVGIVHRDLKPHNIFLAKTAAGPEVKVLDFGVAKLTAGEGLAARTQALTATGSMVGTPYYMSPEQVVSEKDLDGRADIWSLGVVMYECLTGVRPTEADNVGRVLKRILLADFEPIEKHRTDLPADVASLITRMLSGEREKRPQSIAEVRAVVMSHASASIPSFGASNKINVGDAHAARIAPAPAAETGQAMSVAAIGPGARSRYVALGALVAASITVVVVVRGWTGASTKMEPPRIIASSSAPAEPSAAPVDTAPLASATSVAIAPPSRPEARVAGSASAATTPIKRVLAASPRVAPSATAAPASSAIVATPAASAHPAASATKGPGILASSPKD